jgi:D-3-phosphoglycerate dehydrogenase
MKIEAGGEVSEYLDSLATFALVGALKESMGEKINYVNADFVAQEKKIDIQINKLTNTSEYKNKIEITLTTDHDSIVIGGTVFDGDIEKIVHVNNIKLDFKPKGRMIFFSNNDKPGVIANISNALSSHNINIADFRLGRGKRDEAFAVVLVDEGISKDVLSELEAIENCNWVSYAVI